MSEELEATSLAGRVGRRAVLKSLAVLAVSPVVSPRAEAQEGVPSARTVASPGTLSGKRDQLFDDDWLFLSGDVAGAEAPSFDDKSWHVVNLPHDWSVEPLPARNGAENGEGDLWGATVLPNRIGPFDTQLSAGGRSTGWMVGGTGWYRRHFSVAHLPPDGQVEITFDGVYKNSDVWLNGHLLALL